MRPLQVLPPVAGPALYDALRVAVDGTGPAVSLTVGGEGDDDVCLVVPTSGSTGEAKQVELTASCLLASGAATATVIGEGRWWLQLPVSHIAGLQVVLRSGFAPSMDADGCDYTSLVPTQLTRM